MPLVTSLAKPLVWLHATPASVLYSRHAPTHHRAGRGQAGGVLSGSGNYTRTGTLWQGRYKASLVQDEQYLLACHRYIELNPVRASMVKGPGEYRWSSYAHNALGKPGALITPHALYSQLHPDPAQRLSEYRALFAATLSTELLEQLRTQTNACLILGNRHFKAQIAGMLGREVEHRKAGRPKKPRR